MEQAARQNVTLTLADLQPGQTGIVSRLESQGPERRRMMDLGIVPGTRIFAEMSSPMGDPVAYRIRGAVVALRREQACLIEINDIVTADKDE
ncbi:MAG: ferrous iron transport protein A [Chloroflexi bacterium]|nr:ferrous iron transport protein A [Chloroflexota bacterium]